MPIGETDGDYSSDEEDVIVSCTVSTDSYSGDSVKHTICYESVEGFCSFEDSGCPKLHASQHYYWQVQRKDNLWINLRPEQVIALEKAYCDPDVDKVELPILDPSKLDKSFKGILKILKGTKKWKANFKFMKLIKFQEKSKTLPIRRLCTEKIIDAMSFPPTIFPHYDWQLKGRRWTFLQPEQCEVLEKAFLTLSRGEIELPELDPSMTTLNKFMNEQLKTILGNKQWVAKLDEMVLVDKESSIKVLIRRHCTENIPVGYIPDQCLYSWYFKCALRYKWIKFGTDALAIDPLLKCKVDSAAIEKHYQQNRLNPLVIQRGNIKYSLNLVTMLQTDLYSNMKEQLKRRPKPHLKVNNDIGTHKDEFRLLWDFMKPLEQLKRVRLQPYSNEYQKILSHYKHCWRKDNDVIPGVSTIERIQNPYLWKAFQNKVQEMYVAYDHQRLVNIQLLFHGTKGEFVDEICKENFDWRLHGSNVGNIRGKGTCFSPYSNVSYAYSYRADVKFCYKFIFIAEVAVGQCIVGNETMSRPPYNSKHKRLYDSTVDRLADTKVIVKYDRQEYYPKYVLMLEHVHQRPI